LVRSGTGVKVDIFRPFSRRHPIVLQQSALVVRIDIRQLTQRTGTLIAVCVDGYRFSECHKATKSSNLRWMMWTIAGISNWETYYYNTDITQFCPNYLGFTPVDDKAIYELTSPMTRIHDASTPTLIQHGELDQRGVHHGFLSTCWHDSYGAALLCL
jgi:hypothetical protein